MSESEYKCRKCGGEMKESKGLVNQLSGSPDFEGGSEIYTVSPSGKADLVPVMKCIECGWQVTI